jgi:hypothetical protein
MIAAGTVAGAPTEVRGSMTTPTLTNLLARTKDGGGDCRIWIGSDNGAITPMPKIRYKDEAGVWQHGSARRMAYELHHGVKLPKGWLVTVTCESSLCICPEHLARTTKSAVSRKALARPTVKARHRRALELAHQPRGKLTHDKAAILRARRGEDADALASEFGISRSLVFKVWQNRAWRDHSNPFSGLGARA